MCEEGSEVTRPLKEVPFPLNKSINIKNKI